MLLEKSNQIAELESALDSRVSDLNQSKQNLEALQKKMEETSQELQKVFLVVFAGSINSCGLCMRMISSLGIFFYFMLDFFSVDSKTER